MKQQYRVQAQSIEPGILSFCDGTFSQCLAQYQHWRNLYDRRIGASNYGCGKTVPMLIVIGRKNQI